MSGPLYPLFRKNSKGELLLCDSAEGKRAGSERPVWSPPLTSQQVEEQAKERVTARYGSLGDKKDVLGEYTIQSGKYRGRPFRWLLEHVPGYVGWFVGQIIRDEGKDPSNIHQKHNKGALKHYVQMFSEGRSIVARKSAETPLTAESSTPVGELPQAPSRFQGLLKGRNLPPEVLRRKLKGITSTPRVKPTIPSTQTRDVEQLPALITAEEVKTVEVNQTTVEDEELASYLEQVEADLPSDTQSSEVLLYQGWKSTLPKVDHGWISKTFFKRNPLTNKMEFRPEKLEQLWHSPPPPTFSPSVRNKVDRYFSHRVFLWMPVNMWAIRLLCPHSDENGECKGILTRAGIHQKTRLVLDVDSYYIIAAEYLRCSSCGRKVVSWAHNLLSQLDNDHRMLFPCILTARLACDRKVVALLRNRGLGNSSSMVCKQLEEEHGDNYLRQCHHYLTECHRFQTAAQTGLLVHAEFEPPTEMISIPRHCWLMKVYQLDVLQRLDYIKASITSLFGSVLKIDSTKKITKKLAGRSAKTAMWATNVGNEHGQVIMTVLTTGEGQGLRDMITGVTDRYRRASVDPPKLLYVDRDCCGGSAISKYFDDWPFLSVRLDIWHFMRRLSNGCTTDAHPLYGIFMGRVSHCIFRWEEEDIRLLKKAKRAEMTKRHIPNPSDNDVVGAITRDELALHCRRVTRGAEETVRLLSNLIESMDGDKGLDILGVPLIDTIKMREIWEQQSRHVGCIQDPENFQLYTRTGTLVKGGVTLPTYRCARGSTSLESFHLHMARFIPGTVANDVNFQVYLLDGVYRWNEDRRRDALSSKMTVGPLSYDGPLQQAVNKLSVEVLGKEICTNFLPPKKFTGELLGLEYLFAQSSGLDLEYNAAAEAIEADTGIDEEESSDLSEAVDEGFVEPVAVEDITVPMLDTTATATPSVTPVFPTSASLDITAVPSTSGEDLSAHGKTTAAEFSDTSQADDSDLGPDNIPGYACVLKLATFLASLREQLSPLTSNQADIVIRMWDGLSDYDKQRTKFPLRASSSPGPGRFKSPKKQVALGVTSIERAILGPNSTRASWPNCNRYVEATVENLVAAYPSDRRSKKTQSSTTRWNLVKDAYSRIQGRVISNRRVMDQTDIQMPSLNIKTIQQWYNQKGKSKDLKVLVQGLDLPQPSMSGTGAPPPIDKPASFTVGEGTPFCFPDPVDTAGMAKLKRPRLQTSTATSSSVFPTPFILPTQPQVPSVRLPVLAAAPIQFRTIMPAPSQDVPASPKLGGQPKRKYTRTVKFVRCLECGEERVPPLHKQYMGYRFCGKTEARPFEEWRACLQARGVARKK